MKLFENSIDLVIMIIFQEYLKIDFLHSFFKVTKNSRGVTGYTHLIMFVIHYVFLK